MASITIATASYDRHIRLWEARTGRPLRQFAFHDSQVNCLALSPDRVKLAAGGNPFIRLFDISHSAAQPPINQQIASSEEGKHSGNVTALGFLRSGGSVPLLWSVSEDGHIKLWECRTPSMRLRRDADCKAPINCAAVMPDQSYLFTGSQLGTVSVWPLAANHHQQQQQQAESGGATVVAGSQASSGGGGGSSSSSEWCSLQDLALGGTAGAGAGGNGSVAGGATGGEDVPIRTISVSPGGEYIVVGTNSGHIHCLRLRADEDRALAAAGGNQTTAPSGGEPSEGGAQQQRGNASSIGGANTVLLQPFHSFQAHQKYILRAHISPVGNTLVTTSADYTIAVWSIPDAKVRYGSSSSSNATAAISGNKSANGAEDKNNAAAAAASSSTPTGSPTSQNGPGNLSAAGGAGVDGAASGKGAASTKGNNGAAPVAWPALKTLSGHSRWVWDCSFSSCGQFLVSASSDHTARLWDVNSGKVIVSYNHQKPVTCVVVEDRKVEGTQ